MGSFSLVSVGGSTPAPDPVLTSCMEAIQGNSASVHGDVLFLHVSVRHRRLSCTLRLEPLLSGAPHSSDSRRWTRWP